MADITTTVQDGETLELAYNVVNTSPHVGRQQQVELVAPDGTVIDSDAILLEAEDSERGVLRTGALSETDSSDEGVYEVISEEGSRTVQVYVGIPDTLLSRPDDNTSASDAVKAGIVMETNDYNLDGISAVISNNTSGATTAYLLDNTDTVLTSTDISSLSSGDLFDLTGVTLSKNTKYRIAFDAGGSSYTIGVNNNDPLSSAITGEAFDLVAGYINGSENNNAHCLNDVRNLGY